MTEKQQDDDQVIEGWDEEDEVILYQYAITSYGADYPVESLVARMDRGDIFIPHFQRDYVWSPKDASRFIETLLLGLPVPGLFLSKEQETQKLLVIDGQQRLRTLQFFYDGIFEPTGKRFSLSGVQPQFEGKTYRDLSSEEQRVLNDSIIHLTIVHQDEPSDDNSSIYYIFERLNTTGRILSPQEIRACLYHGEFNEALKDLNSNPKWRKLFGPVNKRMRDQELILRFFALNFLLDKYEKPMKGFLNKYMSINRNLELHSKEVLSKSFIEVINSLSESIGDRVFKPTRALNAAVFDSIMVGLSMRLKSGPIKKAESISKEYSKLMKNKKFIEAYETATTDYDSIMTRIELTTKAFGKLD